jgi:hypothetical protein
MLLLVGPKGIIRIPRDWTNHADPQEVPVIININTLRNVHEWVQAKKRSK